MADIKYYVWCETENTFKLVWAAVEPTVCPTNVTHTIDTRRTRTDLLKYYVYCTTEDEYVGAWAYADEAVPSECPNSNPPNNVHSIDASKTHEVTECDTDPGGRNKKENIEKNLEGETIYVHGYSWKWCPYANESYTDPNRIPSWLPRFSILRSDHNMTGGKMSIKSAPRPGFVCWDNNCYYYTTITISGARYFEV